MNKLKEPSKLEHQGYSGVKVTSQISALVHSSIKPHLRLVQQDNVYKIKNRYDRNGRLTATEMKYIWRLYWNFVINDFRYPKSLKLKK